MNPKGILKMHFKDKLLPLALSTACLLASNSWAASVTDNVVYETAAIFNNETYFTDTFQVSQAGTYQATLTDFEFPNLLSSSGLNVTTSTGSLATLYGPGSVTFEANPGDYYVSLFATVGQLVSAEEKESLIEEERKRRGKAWWQNLTKEQKAERKAMWAARTEDEREANRQKVRARAERVVEERLSSIDIGQYGIQILLVDGTGTLPNTSPSPVPVPAAAWLFGSGLLGLAGVVRKKTA